MITLLIGILAGCSTTQAPVNAPTLPPVGGRASVVGIASWYGPGFNGHRTSSGEIYDQEALTAASVLFPLGTRLMVTNLENGRSVEVVVNDHGPYVKGRGLDLSAHAARMLGMVGPGTTRVRMDVMQTPPGGPPIGPRYYVQVGSYSDPQNARRMGERLAAHYDDVGIVQAEAGDSRYYRVRMGAFMNRRAAEERASRVAGFGVPVVIITE